MTTLVATLFERIRPQNPLLSSDEGTVADINFLMRFLSIILLLTGAVAIYLWSHMEVTGMAVALDRTRGNLARAEMVHDRLVLERSVLRQPGRLQAEADRLGLVAPAAVVTVPNPRTELSPAVATSSTGPLP